MSDPKISRPIQGQIVAVSSDYVTCLEGPVMLAYGATTLRLAGVLRQFVGSPGVKTRYRAFTVRPNNPSTGWTDGSAHTTADVPFVDDHDISSLGSYMWIQPAVAGAAVTGSSAECFGSFGGFLNGSSKIVAHETVQIDPTVNSGSTAIYPIGTPFITLGANGVMVAAVVGGVSGTYTFNLVGRTFTASRDLPSAWSSDLLGSDASFTANGEYNSGGLTPSLGNTALAQLGLKVTSTTATATMEIFVAASY